MDQTAQEKAKKDFIRYYLQLTKGCGKPNCSNPNCVSVRKIGLPASDAVAECYKLMKMNNPQNLCRSDIEIFDYAPLEALVNECKKNNNYTQLIRKIGVIFSSIEAVNLSFLKDRVSLDDADLGLNMDAVRNSFRILESINDKSVMNSLFNALEALVRSAKMNISTFVHPQSLRFFLILFENSQIFDHSNHQSILLPLSQCILQLPKYSQDYLMRWWSSFSPSQFQQLLGNLHQCITLRILLPRFGQTVNNDDGIVIITKLLMLLYLVNDRKKLVNFSDFNNELINETIDLKEDFINWKRERGFSFCNYPFILDPMVKSRVLQIESAVQQQQQRTAALHQMLMGHFEVPALVIKVRREHLIEDSLSELSKYDPEELKKELRVHFMGEEAIDEGGVQKEWFQLIVREIFDEKYGMFVVNSETRTYWFNGYSTDFLEFELIGKMLGLAIYNGVILDVHFPRVLYKKLMGVSLTFEDLKETHPALAVGLEKLMQFDGDVEETFGMTFQITEEFYGAKRLVNLKDNGDQIPLTNANRDEYVQLYINYLLVNSISKPFDYFLRGFLMLCNSPAFKMFRYEELELLICGSPVLDFEALEKNAIYDNGYTKDHPVIKNFWSVVHSLTMDQKKRLLFFSTGSDRAPIGGLGKMSFVITRHGPDSDRLPSAHTCFNHLLLPEYSSKEKLQERLLAAINNAEGFGML